MSGSTDEPTTPEPTVEEVRLAIASLREAIDAAHRQIENGGDVDLAGMEQHVARLCARLTRLDRARGEPLVDDMLTLLDDFQALGGELGRRHDRLAAELQHLARHRKAMKAYGASGRPQRS